MKKADIVLEDWPAYESIVHDLGKQLRSHSLRGVIILLLNICIDNNCCADILSPYSIYYCLLIFISCSTTVKQLLTENNPLQNAIVLALGELARQGPLPLPAGSEEDEAKTVTSLSLVKALVTIFGNKKIPSKVYTF